MRIRAWRCRMLAVVAILVSTTLAAAAPPLADRLPADASLYVGWAGQTEALQGSLFGQLLSELPTDEIAAALGQAIDKGVGDPRTRGLVGHGIGAISIAARHPAALCVTALPADPGSAEPRPDAALLIDLGADRQAFDEHLAPLLAALGEQIPIDDVATGALRYKRLDLGAKAPPIAIGYLGDMLFVAMGERMPFTLAALQSGGGETLATAAKFNSAYRQVTGSNEQFVVYADVPALATTVSRILEQSGEKPSPSPRVVFDALGLGKITAVASTTRVVDGLMYTKTRVLSPAPHQGVLMPFAGKPLTAADMAVAPADTDLLMTCNLDPSALWNEIQRIVAAVDPEAAGAFQLGVGMVEGQLGLSIADDLLAHVGDQFTLVSAPSLGGFVTGTAIVVELKNADALETALAQLEAIGRSALAASAAPVDPYGPGRRAAKAPSIRSFAAGDATITYLQLPVLPAIAPAWAVSDDKLIIALWPQVVRAVIEGPGGPGLNTDAEFLAAFGRLSGSPTMLSYVNEPAIARRVHALPLVLWTSLATLLDSRGIPLKVDWLPALPTILRYMRPSIAACSADAGGVTQEGYRALPFSSFNAATPAMAVSFLLPSLGRARHLARQSVSMAHLKAIGMGVAMYRVENRDASPPNLQALVEAAYINPESLISPQTNEPYVYIPLPANAPNNLILAYEDPAEVGLGEAPVLFNDMHVEMLPVNDAFWQRVRQSKQAAGVSAE